MSQRMGHADARLAAVEPIIRARSLRERGALWRLPPGGASHSGPAESKITNIAARPTLARNKRSETRPRLRAPAIRPSRFGARKQDLRRPCRARNRSGAEACAQTDFLRCLSDHIGRRAPTCSQCCSDVAGSTFAASFLLLQHRSFNGPPAAGTFGEAIDASVLEIMRKPSAANDIDTSRGGLIL